MASESKASAKPEQDNGNANQTSHSKHRKWNLEVSRPKCHSRVSVEQTRPGLILENSVVSIRTDHRPIVLNDNFATHKRVLPPNDPNSATAATRRADCNRGGPPPFAAAHG